MIEMDTPYALVSLEVVGSTQDEARARFAGSPVLVVAPRQTAGRGRHGATWETAPRALAVSLAYSSDWEADSVARVPLVAGLSLNRVLPGRNNLKWPNDVVRGSDKLGGILVERSDETVVVGVGVNLWWPGAPEGYGAVFAEDPGPLAHRQVAERWAIEFLRRVAGDATEWGKDEYRAVCSTVGQQITWEPDGSGTAVDVDEDGALLVETSAGIERLVSGAIREVRGIEPPG